MITVDPIRRDATILYSAMQLLGACKNVNHRFVAVINVGERVVTRRGEKCVLDSQAMGEINRDQIGATRISSSWSVWSEHLAEFVTIASAQFCINVSTHDDLGIAR